MSYNHASRLADHVMSEAPCRSFHFSRPKSSAYWFNLMWIRGKLILTGDGCDMTFTHYQACSSFDAAIKWASESEMDYLLRKADQQEEYDAHATLQAIIQWANAPVIEALNGGVDERYVQYVEDGRKKYRTVRTPRRDGYRHLRQEYRRAVAAGLQQDFLDNVEVTDPRPITRRETRCLVPGFDGVIFSREWKEALWDRYVMAAPRPRTRCEQQYSDRRLRSWR